MLVFIIGKRFIEAGVVAEGSVSAFMEDRNYNSSGCVHELVYEAFTRVALEGFYPCLDKLHPEGSRQVQTCFDEPWPS